MDQADRDRLASLKKAKKKLITQKEAAEELDITERQVRRLLRKLKKRGDKAVVHALRGQPSNRKTEVQVQQRAVRNMPDHQVRLELRHTLQPDIDGREVLQHAVERIRVVKDFRLGAGLDLVIDVREGQFQVRRVDRREAGALPAELGRQMVGTLSQALLMGLYASGMRCPGRL